MIAAQTWWSSVALFAVGAIVTAIVGYLSTSMQFRRQQKVEHERWLREQRLSAYRRVGEVLRRSEELAEDFMLVDYAHDPYSLTVVRGDAPVSLNSALASAQLVAGADVRRSLKDLDRILWGIREDGADRESVSELLDTVQALEVAMQQEVQE